MKREFHLTKEGVKELELELKSLNAKKPEIAEKIRLAREQGDLTENAEYQISKDELARVEGRVSEIEHILKNVELITGPRRADSVKIGTTVHLKDGSTMLIYTIVGSVEADPVAKKISDESPIGQALIGKKIGDKVSIETPAGKTSYTIARIS